jgi:hypothetical protein
LPSATFQFRLIRFPFSSLLEQDTPKKEKTINFFQKFAKSTEYDRNMLFSNLEKWWKRAPNYKRRRLITVLEQLSKETPFEKFREKAASPPEVELPVE